MNRPHTLSRSADMTHGLRHPRTLREAFGPDAALDSDDGDAVNGWAAGVILALIVLALWMGWHW